MTNRLMTNKLNVPRGTLNNYLPKYTIKIEISEGVIPDILEACPIVLGLTLVNFSRASFDKEVNLM